jgi:hypothetical protein
MAVYAHKANTSTTRRFLVTDEVERSNSTTYMVIEWVVSDVGEETFTAKQPYPIAGLSLTEWELSLDYTGAMAVFHRFHRS